MILESSFVYLCGPEETLVGTGASRVSGRELKELVGGFGDLSLLAKNFGAKKITLIME
jgi:hypothetical protein